MEHLTTMGFSFDKASRAARIAAGNAAVELLMSGVWTTLQQPMLACHLSSVLVSAGHSVCKRSMDVPAGHVSDAGIPEMTVQAEVDDLCCIANTLNINTAEIEAAVLKHYGNHREALKVQQWSLWDAWLFMHH